MPEQTKRRPRTDYRRLFSDLLTNGLLTFTITRTRVENALQSHIEAHSSRGFVADSIPTFLFESDDIDYQYAVRIKGKWRTLATCEVKGTLRMAFHKTKMMGWFWPVAADIAKQFYRSQTHPNWRNFIALLVPASRKEVSESFRKNLLPVATMVFPKTRFGHPFVTECSVRNVCVIVFQVDKIRRFDLESSHPRSVRTDNAEQPKPDASLNP